MAQSLWVQSRSNVPTSKYHKPPAAGAAQHWYVTCTKSHAPRRASCPDKDLTCKGCGCKGHWQLRCCSGVASQKQKTEAARGPRGYHHQLWDRGPKDKCAVDVEDDYNPQCHEVGVARIAFYAPSHAEWLTTVHCHLKDTKPVVITDVNTDAMTKAYSCADAFPNRTKLAWKPKM